MAGRVHALMQNPDNNNAVAREPKIDDVLLNAAPPITRTNSGAPLRLLWSVGQIGTGGFDNIGVTQGLRQAPLRYAKIEYPIKIALRTRTEPSLSHTAPLYVA